MEGEVYSELHAGGLHGCGALEGHGGGGGMINSTFNNYF